MLLWDRGFLKNKKKEREELWSFLKVEYVKE